MYDIDTSKCINQRMTRPVKCHSLKMKKSIDRYKGSSTEGYITVNDRHGLANESGGEQYLNSRSILFETLNPSELQNTFVSLSYVAHPFEICAVC